MKAALPRSAHAGRLLLPLFMRGYAPARTREALLDQGGFLCGWPGRLRLLGNPGVPDVGTGDCDSSAVTDRADLIAR